MNTSELKRFAQKARRQLLEQVAKRLDRILSIDDIEARERAATIRELKQQIDETSRERVIDKVAYIWFNRFCALRFMDLNKYTRIGTVSPAEGHTLPEILQDAKQGQIDDEIAEYADTEKVLSLLTGKLQSPNPQQEAYRLLLVAVCNYYNKVMPFMFERIADYTELLMPEDLLSESSVLHEVQQAMTVENCQDVEIIGWLYQYYISERKDEVFAALKKNKKIGAEDIPAATQLFTPHWIVQYLTENSLGRLWMLNHPESKLIDSMLYYIKPESREEDFLKISSPEELRICDPACGSGHILVYAFDLLYRIYEEQGYNSKDIPYLILEKNLYGIEIDERAGELAAFALVMKARARYRRFFHFPQQPNICVLQNITFSEGELEDYINEMGDDIFSKGLKKTLLQFQDSDTYGSLIQPEVADVSFLLAQLYTTNLDDNVFLSVTHYKVIKALLQAEYLSPSYHVVVANPPYMGGKGMNQKLKKFAQDNYKDSKSDLFAMFIERGLSLIKNFGYSSMITMQSWMFLSSFENLRSKLVNNATIVSMAHLGPRAFDSIGGEVVQTTAFVTENQQEQDYKGAYLRLIDGRSEKEKIKALKEAIQNPDCGWFFRASASDFKKIPGSPIAYWVSEKVKEIFDNSDIVSKFSVLKHGMSTSDNNQYLRQWFEVTQDNIGFNFDSKEHAKASSLKWFPYNKGGSFRRWYGNNEFLVNWQYDGLEIKKVSNIKYPYLKGNLGFVLGGQDYFFQQGITWSSLSSGKLSMRAFDKGFIFDAKGQCLFLRNQKDYYLLLGFLNTNIVHELLKMISPTLDYNSGKIAILPIILLEDKQSKEFIDELVSLIIDVTKLDWDSYETSWDFEALALINEKCKMNNEKCEENTLAEAYHRIRAQWQEMTLEMQRLEEENNRIFIEAYGLQEELTPEVPLKEITLTCNPYYRYKKEADPAGMKNVKCKMENGEERVFPINDELEARLLADTMIEFISYAVGCMFGRYSLDKPGLILANQGETLEDYLKQIPEPSYLPDEDNVIPILEGNWFTDDIVERFLQFLRVSFGEKYYEENLQFIENAIGKDLRKFFLSDFYDDHIKRYKKRPIYWLFSSPKGSFNALIYIHRYRPDTVSVILNDYLREFRTKLIASKEHLEQVSFSMSASGAEKTSALKEIDKLKKMITELNDYEKEILYPLATKQLEIDLDDGVKVNYNKFGKALQKFTGLSGE